jgi:hypothetical protein
VTWFTTGGRRICRPAFPLHRLALTAGRLCVRPIPALQPGAAQASIVGVFG